MDKSKLNFEYDEMGISDIYDSKFNIGNFGNSQTGKYNRNFRADNQPTDRKDGNAYNDYEQKLFNNFLKKLIDVESNIVIAKAYLTNNPDFDVEDVFETNDNV